MIDINYSLIMTIIILIILTSTISIFIFCLLSYFISLRLPKKMKITKNDNRL